MPRQMVARLRFGVFTFFLIGLPLMIVNYHEAMELNPHSIRATIVYVPTPPLHTPHPFNPPTHPPKKKPCGGVEVCI